MATFGVFSPGCDRDRQRPHQHIDAGYVFTFTERDQGSRAFLLGLEVFTTLASSGQIALIDLGSVAIADSTVIDLSVSREATIEMDSTPAVPGRLVRL